MVLNLWVTTPVGCLLDIYIMIQNSRKATIMK